MAFSPQQEAVIRAQMIADFTASIDAQFDRMISVIKQYQQGIPIVLPPAAPKPSAPPLPAPLPAPLAATLATKLPPQPLSSPIPARSYPPPPSVETIEEVEHKQVYKPLRNIKQMRQKHAIRQKHMMRQKHNALKKVPISKTHFFEKFIRWPPRFSGIYMSFSRNEELDAWYTTMLNHSQKLIHASPHLA